jgi:hypothetical protein
VRASILLVVGLLLLLSCGHAQTKGADHWEGSIQVAGIALAIRVDISVAGDSTRATIDIPQQNAIGLSLRAVRMTKDSLSFELPAGPGVASFDGTVAGDTAWGAFRQAGMVGTFHLRRAVANLAHGSTPEVPPPYTSREVSFRNGDVTLAGTLTVPPSRGPHPALILLTGSGAQTRDEDVFGFRVFAALADTLTRLGVAVLRFDDRGTGGSGGNPADVTTQGYAGDARSAFEFLRTDPDIDRTRIGILGHSEGAVAACLAAAKQSAISFLVLMAGPSLRGDAVILGQIETLGRAAGLTSTEIGEQSSLQRRVYDVVRSDAGWDSLQALLVREALRRSPGADTLVRMQVEGQMRLIRSPWFRSFIDLDPAIPLRQVSVPVLALLGEKDMQVPPATNQPILEGLREKEGRKNLTVMLVPGANHLFQSANTGHPGEYATLKREFSGEFLDRLIPWVAQQTGLRR